MNRPRLTSAASALLRGLVARSGSERDRICLSSWISTDWHSLTFAGERHQAGFTVTGPDALQLAKQWTDGLEEAEFDLGRHGFVAEIALSAPLRLRDDGACLVEIEALTLED